ncbi:hypothetical protein D3C81_971100 [compost metagenome]
MPALGLGRQDFSLADLGQHGPDIAGTRQVSGPLGDGSRAAEMVPGLGPLPLQLEYPAQPERRGRLHQRIPDRPGDLMRGTIMGKRFLVVAGIESQRRQADQIHTLPAQVARLPRDRQRLAVRLPGCRGFASGAECIAEFRVQGAAHAVYAICGRQRCRHGNRFPKTARSGRGLALDVVAPAKAAQNDRPLETGNRVQAGQDCLEHLHRLGGLTGIQQLLATRTFRQIGRLRPWCLHGPHRAAAERGRQPFAPACHGAPAVRLLPLCPSSSTHACVLPARVPADAAPTARPPIRSARLRSQALPKYRRQWPEPAGYIPLAAPS